MNPRRSRVSSALCAIAAGALPMLIWAGDARDQFHGHENTRAHRTLVVTTQGPPWPPSTVTDANGDFVVVGTILTEVSPGNVQPMQGAALVSKHTVPPLNAAGMEDFSNFLGAPHKVIRKLDLRRGSRDLAIQLFTPSYGPPKGNFGGGGRIPMAGETRYNLNAIPSPCPEVFPAASQAYTYKRPAFALHEYPIDGFQGDQVAYDVDTGEPYDPRTRTGPSCGPGCLGESEIDERSSKPITLGRWLRAKGEMDITLTRYDRRVKAFTAARFNFEFSGLIPNSMYTLWALRQRVFTFGSMPGPFKLPSSVISDDQGNAWFEVEINNPFPDRALDPEGKRIIGVELSYHPDQQNWGACGEKWGVGYRTMNWFDMLPDGSRDLSNLVTRKGL
ncbi:MAG TPA: hypothetical protein VFR18_26705 [Terriglobia bacterium]|nr:hypothetical protein [Terriglobia bacterium]HEU5134150.1 hypothetical protein [Steroidobacteraceae bacterium]